MNQGQAPTLRRALLWLWPAVPVLAALLFTSGLLLVFDTSPLEAFQAMYAGAFGDSAKQLSTLAFLVPLFLASSGLLVTFRAGLWNIGIEGQIVLGAIAASWVALMGLNLPGP
ncbi:MAG: ABC transporter permease, partial [Chloroflexota bacterium]